MVKIDIDGKKDWGGGDSPDSENEATPLRGAQRDTVKGWGTVRGGKKASCLPCFQLKFRWISWTKDQTLHTALYRTVPPDISGHFRGA